MLVILKKCSSCGLSHAVDMQKSEETDFDFEGVCFVTQEKIYARISSSEKTGFRFQVDLD